MQEGLVGERIFQQSHDMLGGSRVPRELQNVAGCRLLTNLPCWTLVTFASFHCGYKQGRHAFVQATDGQALLVRVCNRTRLYRQGNEAFRKDIAQGVEAVVMSWASGDKSNLQHDSM